MSEARDTHGFKLAKLRVLLADVFKLHVFLEGAAKVAKLFKINLAGRVVTLITMIFSLLLPCADKFIRFFIVLVEDFCQHSFGHLVFFREAKLANNESSCRRVDDEGEEDDSGGEKHNLTADRC